MMERIAEASPRFKARIAGVLSLLSSLTAAFTELFVRGGFNIAGDLSSKRGNPLNVWSGVPASRMKGSVLVIASDSLRGGNMSEILRGAGYTVKIASDSLTGADVPAGTQVVVLVGPRPPWRIEHICANCIAIRDVAPKLPVIVVGPNDVEAKVHLFKLGADDYVVESFDRTEFLARIDSLIRRVGTGSS